MKIVFICGSLEPGHDGVGDYTRIFASEMINRKHEVVAVALKDSYTTKVIKEIQSVNAIGISVLRIPLLYSEIDRYKIARAYICEAKPDLISLQFVIYAFDPRGLAFGLGKKIYALCRGWKVHIMFHELWIGITELSTIKHKIIGGFQRKIIVSLIKLVKPELVTTSNILYKAILSKEDVISHILPLFSNISINPLDQSFKREILRTLSIDEIEICKFLIVGIFGNLYPDTNLYEALNEQFTLAKKNNKKLIFIGFGNINGEGLKEYDRLKAQFSGKINFFHLGPQSEKNISNLMQILNAAFSCTPASHIGKSGAFAALKLHGVKVIIPKGSIVPEYDVEIKNFNDELIEREAAYWGVSHIGGHFLTLIQTI